MELIGYLIVALIAFGAGLLVGRRNPAIANAAANVANAAKTEVSKVAPSPSKPAA